MMPMLMTSSEKIPAARGVPNRAAKQALMPHITAIFLSFSSSRIIFPMIFPRLPPSCRAAPSRPTEALTRWLKIVDAKISGAVATVISSLEEMAASTVLVPPFFSSRNSL